MDVDVASDYVNGADSVRLAMMPQHTVGGSSSSACRVYRGKRAVSPSTFGSCFLSQVAARVVQWPRVRRHRRCKGKSLVTTASGNDAKGMDKQPVMPWIPSFQRAGGRVVIFSQLKECSELVESFTRHYAGLGFYKMLLYLDDPIGDSATRDVLQQTGWIDAGFVEIIDVTDALRATWPSMPSWGRVGSHCDMEVQSRQILNNENALQRAKSLGADWLLHVDCDELLSLDENAPAFFGDLSDRGCTMYTFSNVEGIPQSADSLDTLRSVRHFRQNMGYVPRTPEAGAAFFSWQLRLGGWFISYENGKSAVSVKHAIKCLSVCMWEVKPQLEVGAARNPDGSTCTWYTNNRLLWEAAKSRRAEGRLADEEEVPRLDVKQCGAVLLHFCVCDFASFWKKRWTQLGYLSASDQFRVRASAGAMMSRFYRLQREGRQRDGRELYEHMCVLQSDEVLQSHVRAGVVIHRSPERLAAWPKSPRQINYADLATVASTRGDHFGAWRLAGKALENVSEVAPFSAEVRGLTVRHASLALAAKLSACALCYLDIGIPGHLHLDPEIEEIVILRSRALQDLGRLGEAIALMDAYAHCSGASPSPQPSRIQQELRRLTELHGRVAVSGTGDGDIGSFWHSNLPTPADLQRHVLKAVWPDEKNSRLYQAVLAVAMGWWQEVGGNPKEFPNALARAALVARTELAALSDCCRPQPIKAVRQLWDQQEAMLKRDGVCRVDLPATPELPGFWENLRLACKSTLGEKTSAVAKGSDRTDHPLNFAWSIFRALAAEVARAFGIVELTVLTEVRVSKIGPTLPQGGPEVDNGGLLPDNRREASFRIFISSEGKDDSSSSVSVALKTMDGERALTVKANPRSVFVWWSRQTFYQFFSTANCFAIAGWAAVLQKSDHAVKP